MRVRYEFDRVGLGLGIWGAVAAAVGRLLGCGTAGLHVFSSLLLSSLELSDTKFFEP